MVIAYRDKKVVGVFVRFVRHCIPTDGVYAITKDQVEKPTSDRRDTSSCIRQ
jgi:hypothetical protein